MDLLVAALALTLGLLVGYGVGALRGIRHAARLRAAAGSAAMLARILPTELPKRTVLDMASGQIRLALGGRVFAIPVLPRKASREWLATVDASWRGLGEAMEQASEDTPAVVALLMAHQDELLAMIRAYDATNVLPDPEWIDEYVTDGEVFLAAIELWRAAHPLAAAVAEAANSPTTSGTSPAPSSAPRASTAGRPTTSTSA